MGGGWGQCEKGAQGCGEFEGVSVVGQEECQCSRVGVGWISATGREVINRVGGQCNRAGVGDSAVVRMVSAVEREGSVQ